MRLSKWAVLAAIPGRDDVLAVQPITGQAALLPASQVNDLARLGDGSALDASLIKDLKEAGFVVESDEDERTSLAEAYATYLQNVEKTPTQLIVVPSFGCNLRCVYCYQEPFTAEGKGVITPENIDALFAYIDRFHAAENPKPYITLFGGEPLVDAPTHRDRIDRILRGALARNLKVAVVTNGHDLEVFLPMLAAGPVKEVQVTLDGPELVHDQRRPHASGSGTFARIIRGIDGLIARQIPVNLRVVVDKENIEALPELASLAADKGWLALPDTLFKTQIGRNYELFGCAAGQHRDQLFDRVALWARFIELAEQHPDLARFHHPRFHGISHLHDTGELPPPNFDACPATKKEWAFGPDGAVYGCTATVGNQKYKLGTYAPEASLDEAAVAKWRGRNVLSIPACKSCALAPMCGGGCGALASRLQGDILAPDCRPVKELLGLGAKYYRLAEES